MNKEAIKVKGTRGEGFRVVLKPMYGHTIKAFVDSSGFFIQARKGSKFEDIEKVEELANSIFAREFGNGEKAFAELKVNV